LYKILWHGGNFVEKWLHGGNHKSYKKEASILARLDHPNIAPSFCYATTNHSCSIVMELLDEDLHDLMQRKPLDAPSKLLEVIDIMLQIAESTHYLHQNMAIHSDLKSMNIFVKCGEHVSVKVADFGLSKIKESSCTNSYQTTD
jgi:serine/threonine protein kinase